MTMRRSIRSKPALILQGVMATTAFILAACGGDDGDKTSASAGTGSGPSSPQIDRNRALLDSLGLYPQAVVVREYVTTKGGVGREYGTFVDLPDAPTTVTVFYRDKLKALGWEATQEQAAVSVYSKGGQTLSITRYGAATPAPAPVQTTTVTVRQAVELKFFFAVEVG